MSVLKGLGFLGRLTLSIVLFKFWWGLKRAPWHELSWQASEGIAHQSHYWNFTDFAKFLKWKV